MNQGRADDGSEDPERGVGPRPSGEPQDPNAGRRFDWRGWVLVATVAVSFLLVPGAILLLPGARDLLGSFGLSLRDAYLTLPLLPAFLLGAVAVWSAIRARSG